MSAALISTCVGGRRAGLSQPVPVPAKPQPPVAEMRLTPRETQVIEAVIDTGFCTLAAVRLGMSVKTIEVHMLRLREKHGALSNYQLIAAYVAGKKRTGGFE